MKFFLAATILCLQMQQGSASLGFILPTSRTREAIVGHRSKLHALGSDYLSNLSREDSNPPPTNPATTTTNSASWSTLPPPVTPYTAAPDNPSEKDREEPPPEYQPPPTSFASYTTASSSEAPNIPAQKEEEPQRNENPPPPQPTAASRLEPRSAHERRTRDLEDPQQQQWLQHLERQESIREEIVRRRDRTASDQDMADSRYERLGRSNLEEPRQQQQERPRQQRLERYERPPPPQNSQPSPPRMVNDQDWVEQSDPRHGRRNLDEEKFQPQDPPQPMRLERYQRSEEGPEPIHPFLERFERPQGERHLERAHGKYAGLNAQEAQKMQQQEDFISGSKSTYFNPGNYGGTLVDGDFQRGYDQQGSRSRPPQPQYVRPQPEDDLSGIYGNLKEEERRKLRERDEFAHGASDTSFSPGNYNGGHNNLSEPPQTSSSPPEGIRYERYVPEEKKEPERPPSRYERYTREEQPPPPQQVYGRPMRPEHQSPPQQPPQQVYERPMRPEHQPPPQQPQQVYERPMRFGQQAPPQQPQQVYERPMRPEQQAPARQQAPPQAYQRPPRPEQQAQPPARQPDVNRVYAGLQADIRRKLQEREAFAHGTGAPNRYGQRAGSGPQLHGDHPGDPGVRYERYVPEQQQAPPRHAEDGKTYERFARQDAGAPQQPPPGHYERFTPPAPQQQPQYERYAKPEQQQQRGVNGIYVGMKTDEQRKIQQREAFAHGAGSTYFTPSEYGGN